MLNVQTFSRFETYVKDVDCYDNFEEFEQYANEIDERRCNWITKTFENILNNETILSLCARGPEGDMDEVIISHDEVVVTTYNDKVISVVHENTFTGVEVFTFKVD